MVLDIIRHQLQFLREDTRGRARLGAIGGDLGERWSVAVTNACVVALNSPRKAIPYADGLWDRLELDLAYVLTRHAFWLKTSAFVDVCADRIARGYRLERAIAERIAREATRIAQADRPFIPSSIEANDTEFMRFVLVVSALARDDDALALDLGLGRGFLTSIKESLSPSLNDKDDSADARYVPDVDTRSANIMLTFAESLRRNQWAMEGIRLSFQLIGVADPWLTWFKQIGTDTLFELLVAIGQAYRWEASTAALQRFNLQLPGSIDDFMAVLMARGLVDPADYSAGGEKRLQRRGWQLSPFSYNLTAEAFAMRFASDPSIAELKKLNESYQAAAVRKLLSSQSPILNELLAYAPQILKPTAARALLDGLASLMQPDQWRKFALSFIHQSTAPWVRLAAVRALTARGEFAVLEEVGAADGSQIVREAALDGCKAGQFATYKPLTVG